MTRREFHAFLFDCRRSLAETGDIRRYQEWYDGHALTVPSPEKVKKTWSILHPIYTRFARRPAPEKPVLAGELHVQYDRSEKKDRLGTNGIYCQPLSDPDNAGSMGFWYWEKELEAMEYEFAAANIEKIRPELRTY